MRRWHRVIFFFAVLVGVMLFAACGSDAPNSAGPQKTPTTEIRANGAIVSSIQTVHVDGYTRKYVCFTYTTVDRGGLWCERVSVE